MRSYRYSLSRPFGEGTLEEGIAIAWSLNNCAERMLKHGLETYFPDITVVVEDRKTREKLIATRWAEEM